MKTAGILSIGTEILRGYTLDTNANFLAKFFKDLNIQTILTATADDGLDSIMHGLDYLRQCDIIVTTGGLGPTEDDVTRDAAAAFCGRKMSRDPAMMQHIMEYFTARQWQIADSNWRQADLIEGGQFIPNPNGTAPGQFVLNGSQMIIILPGPPRENHPMILNSLPDILSKYGFTDGVLLNKIYRIYNIGESSLADAVKDFDFGDHIVGYYFTEDARVELHISRFANDKNEVLDPTMLHSIEDIFNNLGWFWTDDIPLREILMKRLLDSRQTIAFAESLTGGAVSADFTLTPGVSAVHKGGVVSYTDEIKHRILGVSQDALDRYTAVSEQTAAEMAAGLRRLYNTDIAVSLTGIAGPDGGTEETPVGTVCFGFAVGESVTTARFVFSGGRDRIIKKAINCAYIELLKIMKIK
ncbi:MAG: CinA family nicotinamide mononucleotide deamidase-related protein [Spirochaetales bacterium]|nr:CinA family nicotinamide mononucleotide deamidase-related protein [Spirochaetales bacterium]